MDSNSLTLSSASVSPWSKYTLEITTPNYRSLGDDSEPNDGGAGDDHEEYSDDESEDSTEEIQNNVGPPLPRVYHSSSIVSSPSGDIFIFGGLVDGQNTNDTWAIRSSGDSDLLPGPKEVPTHMGVSARFVRTTGNAPSPRIGHRSVLADELLIVWGGFIYQNQNYELSLTYSANKSNQTAATYRWTKLDIQPSPRARAAYAACLSGSKFIVFGGKDSQGRSLSDLWSFDLHSLRRGAPSWERIKVSSESQPLPKTMGHAMVASEDKLYIFGGKHDTHYNTWCFDLVTRARIELARTDVVPPLRTGHAVALVGNVVYMFGGRSENGKDIGDTWSFKISEQKWYEFPSMELEPSIRSGHILATIGRRVFVVGGWRDNETMYETSIHVLDTDMIDYPEYEGETKLQFTSCAAWSGSTAIADTSEGYRRTGAKSSKHDAQETKQIASALEFESKIGDVKVKELVTAIDRLGSDAPIAPSEEAGPYLAQGTTVPTPQDTISRTMSVSEILRYLVSHGCRDISQELDIVQASDYPVSNGGFGDVYCATLRNGDQVGVKCVRMQTDSTEEGRKTLKHAAHELYVWSKCKHPNVIELLGVMLFRDQIAMVSPWVESGNLRRFLSQNSQVDRCAMCVQICDGVDYLHKQSVVHGDLKPDNILVSKNHVPKLTDFGNSALAEYTLQFTHSNTAQVMSLRWAAPEIIQEESKATQASDVYALGMIIFETITGEMPYVGVKDPAIIYKVLERKLPSRPQAHIPTGIEQADRLWSMLTSCWAYNPSDRPKAWEVRNMTASIAPRNLLSNEG